MSSDAIRMIKIFGMAGAAAILAACASNKGGADRDLPLMAKSDSGATVSTNVNRYLWRASLDTIVAMPIEAADPMAGLIVTEWYGSPQVPQERYKANVYILDTALRADALRVTLFKQQRTQAGWVDATPNPATAREIENVILTRARELRLNALDS